MEEEMKGWSGAFCLRPERGGAGQLFQCVVIKDSNWHFFSSECPSGSFDRSCDYFPALG